ncbi:MAG: Gfo/Idh/MocA family oxidoreductase [Lentisphaeria bacterium]|nr:Gfo/Idh/MocA family oxidoreductase [Lentisphaeria bacterium]
MKVKFGVIGADPVLRSNFVFEYFPRERGEMVAICDFNPEMLAAFKEAYPELAGARAYTDYREMLKDPEVEAVFVIVRDGFHEELAVAALEAGKAVYLEKPLAITIEGCDHILETAYRTGSKLMIGHNMRYMDFILKMKEVIDSGIIGEVQAVWCRHFVSYGSCYYRSWCSKQENCTGLLLQKGAHDIDIIHWLTGAYTKRVTAMGKLSVYNRTTNRLKPGDKIDRMYSHRPDCWPPLETADLQPEMDVEDHSMMLMQLDNGVQASYEHCMYTPDSERNYTFIGTKGRVENIGDYTGNNIEVHVWTQKGLRREPDIIHKIKLRPGSHGGADVLIAKAFFDFILDNKAPSVSPVAARYAVAAGVQAHYSMRNGNVPADIPPLSPELIEYFDNGQRKQK